MPVKQYILLLALMLTFNCLSAQLSVLTGTVDVTCNGSCDGIATATPSGGMPPYSYLWDDPSAQTDSIAGSLCAGTYIIQVIDAVPDTVYDTVLVSEPSVMTANITGSTNPSCYGLCNGTATVTPSGGTGSYSYLWDNPFAQTTAVAVGLCADTLYTVIVTDSNGCDTTTSVILSQPLPLTSSITSIGASCKGMCDGTATATPSGGTPPYSFQWLDSTFTPLAPPQTDSTATGLCAAQYFVQIFDNNGCFSTTGAIITEPPTLTSSITDTTQASCSGGCIGSATVTPSGGTPPYTYLWNDPNAQTGSTATGLCAGNYAVTVIDTNGCMTTVSINITQPPILTIALVSTIPATCNACDGEATVEAVSGSPPYTYLWNDSLAQTTSTADSLCASTYTVTVTDSNNCIETLLVDVAGPGGLTSTVNKTNASCNSVCDGGAAVSVSGGSFPYTYSWDSSGVAMAGKTDSTITGLCAGNYASVITDSNGCIITVPFIITQPAVFFSSITSFTDVSCNGLCDGTATVTPVGGTLPYTYNWLDNLFNPIGQTAQTANNLCAGTYFASIEDANGCFSTSTVTIAQPLPLTVAVTDTQTVVCACDGFATVTPSGGIAPYSYQWNPSSQTDSTATGLCAGTHNVTVTDANGCAVSLTIVFTTLGGLASSIDTVINAGCNGLCDGEAVVLASGGSPPYSYAWVDLPIDTIPGQTGPLITGLCAGSYLAAVTDSGGCITNAVAVITEPQELISAITNIVPVNCADSCNGSATAASSGGTPPYAYLWDPQTGGQAGTTAIDLCVGTYNVVVTDINNCADTSYITINGPSILFLLTNATCLGICDGEAVAMPIGGTSPYNYLWSDPLAQTDSLATGLCAGLYAIEVTDANNCIITDTANIVFPSVQISHTNCLCDNVCDGTATAKSQGGSAPYSFLWEDGTQDSTITGLCVGSHNVIVTDSNACAVAGSVIIAADNATPAADAGNDIIICEGKSAILGASGGAFYSWGPPSGLSCTNCQSPEASPVSTTTYTLTVSNLTCSDTAEITVTVGFCLSDVPQVFTPNGDGANDIFEIPGIDSYPENKIAIFNRWGNKVFSVNGYHNINNHWNGTSDKGGRLPDGTYFYLFDLGDGSEPYTGFVMIQR